jgi:hypothetical protein
MDPTPLCSSPSVLQIYLVFNWSILNINVKTHLFFEFRFAAFPGKTITNSSNTILIHKGIHRESTLFLRVSLAGHQF